MNNYEAVVEQYCPVIYKICRAYTAEQADFEDLYQEILIQLWKALPGFSGKSKLSTWVYRVALNNALVYRRNLKRREDKQARYAAEARWEAGQSSSHFSDDDVADKDQKGVELLYTCIRELPKADRALIILYLEEKKYHEIADITGLTSSNVGVKINRIKKKLYKMLKESGYGN